MKKKLRLLIYEQECFFDELKKAQRQLLKVSRDKSFLLDRLLQYETINNQSSDSESTQSSDSGNEMANTAPKKKKVGTGIQSTVTLATSNASSSGQTSVHHQSLPSRSTEPPKKRPKLSKKVSSKATSRASLSSSSQTMTPVSTTISEGPMTREEIERHLELKHSNKPHFLSLDVTSHSLPDDIFSHDNSNPGCPATNASTQEDDNADLIIDMAE